MKFNYRCYTLLFIIQSLVLTGWFIQLVLHQTWLQLFGQINWHEGLHFSIFLSFIPFIYSLFILIQKPSLPEIKIEMQDIIISLILIFLGILCWWFFAKEAVYYPIHTYGDESFHSARVPMMAQDFKLWFQYLFHNETRPSFRNEYMMYPALAYVPITAWTLLTKHTGSITDERMFLLLNYLAIIITTYMLARTMTPSKFISILISFIPMSSALLLSYTMSFYIELHYVSILLFSFFLLCWGVKNHSRVIITTAVFVASLAPIIRESALAATCGIILSACIWSYQKNIISSLLRWIGFWVAGLLPFIMYYLAKSRYTDWDKTRTSFTFILHQDYFSLFSYLFIYLGPLIILTFVCFMNTKRHAFLILAAISGIIAAFMMQSIFLPGYMPWTRNYLFYYACFIVLLISALDWLCKKFNKVGLFILMTGIGINFYIAFHFLPNDQLFHESEYVFDIRPITTYLTQHKQQFFDEKIYLYWPKDFPTYPHSLLPPFIHLTKIASLTPEQRFLNFETIQANLPHNAKYVLFYYLKNASKPTAFHCIPTVLKPTSTELHHYRILVDSVDPWSEGRNGVMLLQEV